MIQLGRGCQAEQEARPKETAPCIPEHSEGHHSGSDQHERKRIRTNLRARLYQGLRCTNKQEKDDPCRVVFHDEQQDQCDRENDQRQADQPENEVFVTLGR